jgi:hypothetical protein
MATGPAGQPLWKVISSKIFNSIAVRMLFGVSFRDMNSGMKLYRADVTRELPATLRRMMHRFIPLIVRKWAIASQRFR